MIENLKEDLILSKMYLKHYEQRYTEYCEANMLDISGHVLNLIEKERKHIKKLENTINQLL